MRTIHQDRVLGRQLADPLTDAELNQVSGGDDNISTLTKSVDDPDDQSFFITGVTPAFPLGVLSLGQYK